MPKALWLLVVGMIINVTGASFIWPLNTIYIHGELGRSLTIAGTVLVFNAGAGMVGNLIGGYLFDRIGGYRSILLGIMVTMASAFTLAVFNHFEAYVILLIGLGFGAGIIIPSMYALAGSVWPEGGRRPFNAIYVAQNVGVSLGTALAGLVASYRFDLVFLANGLMYTLFLVIAFFGFRYLQPKKDVSSSGSGLLQTDGIQEHKKRFRALLILCVGFLISWIAYVQWQTTVSVHTQDLGIPLSQYSLLWTINGAMIVFCQPFMRMFIQRWVHSLKSQIYIGLSVFMVAYLILTQAEIFTAFLAAMIVLTIGEMFVWPAVPTIAHQLAPEGKAGLFQGIVNSVATGGRMIGPLFGGFMADVFGMQALFYVLVALFIIGFVTTSIYDRRIDKGPSNQTVAREGA
ncbi:MDR family MFS transporter [Texcoconibacillus texcoconensis]|nr:MFS transporter [Texcoconibacillus texcoconensis]